VVAAGVGGGGAVSTGVLGTVVAGTGVAGLSGAGVAASERGVEDIEEPIVPCPVLIGVS
jgi:hypothetical protein